MRRQIVGAIILILVQALLFAGPAEPGAPESGRDGEVVSELEAIRITNETGSDFRHVFVRSVPGDPWSVDITGSGNQIAAGQGVDYLVHADSAVTNLDIFAVDVDYGVYVRRGIKLLRGRMTDLQLTDRNFAGERIDAARVGTVTLQNTFDDAIWYLFMRPSAAQAFGVELLGSQSTMEPDTLMSFDVLDFTQSLLIDLNAYGRDGEVMDAVQFAGDFLPLRSYDL